MFREPSYLETVPLHGAESPKGSPKVPIHTLAFLRPYLAPHKIAAWASLLSLVVAAVSVLLIGQSLQPLINHGLELTALPRVLFSLFGLVVLMAIASFGRLYLISWIGENVIAQIRRDLFHHTLSLALPYFEKESKNRLLDRLLTDTRLLQLIVGTSFGVMIRNGLLFLGGISLMFVTSPFLSLVTCFMVPVILGVIFIYARFVKKLSHSAQQGFDTVSQMCGEAISGIQTVLAFVREKWFENRFQEQTLRHLHLTRQQLKAQGFMTMMVMSLVFATLCFILWLGAYKIHQGQLSPGEVTSFLFYAIVVAATMGSFSEMGKDLQKAALICQDIQSFLGTASYLTLHSDSKPLPVQAHMGGQGALVFHEVTFCYPSRSTPALHNVSLTLPSQQHVAIVGPSGSGKSTLQKLMLRFYDLTSGAITLGGVNIAEIDPHALRHHLGWIPQDPVLFRGTVGENIAFGREGASPEAILEAALAAGLGADSNTALDAAVSEGGGQLSGGQKQRIAMARVLLKKPSLLLLDEPTAALDSLSEDALLSQLKKGLGDRSALTVTHRLPTIIRAHHIYVLDKGSVIGHGTHDDLMKTCALYQDMYRLCVDVSMLPVSGSKV